jgi:F0F1-type ATP synthase membrane subunit c/vacuolar-type H+-ATPase subunit K
MVRRRVTDNCIAKRLYEKMTPYIQLGGYLILLGSIFTGLWIGFNFIKAAQAATADIEALKQFQEETIVTLAVQKTTDENINPSSTAWRAYREKSSRELTRSPTGGINGNAARADNEARGLL